MPVNRSVPDVAQKRKDWNGLISGFKASDLVFLDESGCNTDMTRRSPGCGSQRLLRCRSHPAGRGPNSFFLLPPLAAVVAVAPKGGRATFYWTPEAGYGAKERAFSVQTKADRHASGSPFGGAGGRKPD